MIRTLFALLLLFSCTLSAAAPPWIKPRDTTSPKRQPDHNAATNPRGVLLVPTESYDKVAPFDPWMDPHAKLFGRDPIWHGRQDQTPIDQPKGKAKKLPAVQKADAQHQLQQRAKKRSKARRESSGEKTSDAYMRAAQEAVRSVQGR